MLAEDVHLFGVEPTVQRVTWSFGANDFLFGDRHILIPNEPNGVFIHYYLKNPSKEAVNITVTDPHGKELAKLEGKTTVGINTVLWDMRPYVTGEDRALRFRRMRDVLIRWVPPGGYVVISEFLVKYPGLSPSLDIEDRRRFFLG